MNSSSQGLVIWLTGLPSSGKTTLAKRIVSHFVEHDLATLWLDSDDLRAVMTPHATYTKEERDIFYGTMNHIATLAAQGHTNVVLSATANHAEYRNQLRNKVDNFVEIWMSCSLEVCIERDTKGLYKQSQEGDVQHLPGVGSRYEAPTSAELILDSSQSPPKALLDETLSWLRQHYPNKSIPQ